MVHTDAASRCLRALFVLTLVSLLALAACNHPKQARVNVPPPPAPEAENEPSTGESPTAAKPEDNADLAEPALPPDARPIETEMGLASWYGPPYHNRRGSNGEVYNMHAMTAAHRTFPLGSIVRVTNIKTGATAVVRITDRGPFIPGRILDLSLAAARKIEVWQPGVAEVRVELMESGAIAGAAGRWAVQIGGFRDEHAADKLADHLTRRYHTANVQRFKSPAGDWWIRVRPLGDDHGRAEEVVRDTSTPEGAVFLVRLD